MVKEKCKIKKAGKGYKYLMCNGNQVAGYSPKKGMWGSTKHFKKFEKLLKKEK